MLLIKCQNIFQWQGSIPRQELPCFQSQYYALFCEVPIRKHPTPHPKTFYRACCLRSIEHTSQYYILFKKSSTLFKAPVHCETKFVPKICAHRNLVLLFEAIYLQWLGIKPSSLNPSLYPAFKADSKQQSSRVPCPDTQDWLKSVVPRIQSGGTHRHPQLDENWYSPSKLEKFITHLQVWRIVMTREQSPPPPEIFAFLNWKFSRRKSKWLNSRKREVIATPASSLLCEERHPWVGPVTDTTIREKETEADAPCPSPTQSAWHQSARFLERSARPSPFYRWQF